MKILTVLFVLKFLVTLKYGKKQSGAQENNHCEFPTSQLLGNYT